MTQQLEKPLTPAEIEQVMEGVDEQTTAKVFCIDGVVCEVLYREVIKRLPYDIMPMQSLMQTAIAAGGGEAHFLSPMTSEMLIMDIPTAKVLQNINKGTVNTVAAAFGSKEVFGPDEDGILRK